MTRPATAERLLRDTHARAAARAITLDLRRGTGRSRTLYVWTARRPSTGSAWHSPATRHRRARLGFDTVSDAIVDAHNFLSFLDDPNVGRLSLWCRAEALLVPISPPVPHVPPSFYADHNAARLRAIALLLNAPPHGHRALEATAGLAAAIANRANETTLIPAWRAYLRETPAHTVRALTETLEHADR